MRIHFISKRQRTFKFVIYEILGEIKRFSFLFANASDYYQEVGTKKDLETRIDYTLNIEVLISFDANGFKLKRIQKKQNETLGIQFESKWNRVQTV